MALHRRVLCRPVLLAIGDCVGGLDCWGGSGVGGLWVRRAPDDVVLRFETVSAGDLAGCALDGGGEGAGHAGEGEAGGVGCYGASVKGGGDHLEEAGGWLSVCRDE